MSLELDWNWGRVIQIGDTKLRVSAFLLALHLDEVVEVRSFEKHLGDTSLMAASNNACLLKGMRCHIVPCEVHCSMFKWLVCTPASSGCISLGTETCLRNLDGRRKGKTGNWYGRWEWWLYTGKSPSHGFGYGVHANLPLWLFDFRAIWLFQTD